MDLIAYDYQMKHTIHGKEPYLQGAAVIFETLQTTMGEELKSLTIFRVADQKQQPNQHQPAADTQNVVFTTLHGELLLAAGGPFPQPVLTGTLNFIKATVETFFGCYHTIKPPITVPIDSDLALKTPLNDPSFLSTVHFISNHISSCEALTDITSHVLYSPRVPKIKTPSTVFTSAMRFIVRRVAKFSLLGAGIYVIKNRSFGVVASTFPTSLDPVLCCVAFSISSQAMARKTSFVDVYLSMATIDELLASVESLVPDPARLFETFRDSHPICADGCDLHRVKIVVTTSNQHITVELLAGECTDQFLTESEFIPSFDIPAPTADERKHPAVRELRIDFATNVVSPENLWFDPVSDQLAQAVLLLWARHRRGCSKLAVFYGGKPSCAVCALDDGELLATLTTLKDVDLVCL